MALEPLPPGDRWWPRSQWEAAVAADVTTGARATAWGPTERGGREREATAPLAHTVGNAAEVLGVNACFVS